MAVAMPLPALKPKIDSDCCNTTVVFSEGNFKTRAGIGCGGCLNRVKEVQQNTSTWEKVDELLTGAAGRKNTDALYHLTGVDYPQLKRDGEKLTLPQYEALRERLVKVMPAIPMMEKVLKTLKFFQAFSLATKLVDEDEEKGTNSVWLRRVFVVSPDQQKEPFDRNKIIVKVKSVPCDQPVSDIDANTIADKVLVKLQKDNLSEVDRDKLRGLVAKYLKVMGYVMKQPDCFDDVRPIIDQLMAHTIQQLDTSNYAALLLAAETMLKKGSKEDST